MDSLKIYNQQGEVIGEKEISSAVFGVKIKQDIIAEVEGIDLETKEKKIIAS